MDRGISRRSTLRFSLALLCCFAWSACSEDDRLESVTPWPLPEVGGFVPREDASSAEVAPNRALDGGTLIDAALTRVESGDGALLPFDAGRVGVWGALTAR